MAKGNLFLGFGRGAVGDVVMYHQNGEQIVRARNRNPKNPQTALQLLQRVCLKTSSMAYALMQDITNHSFQGFAEGTECQSRFNMLNIQRFREQLVDEINSGDADVILTSPAANYAAKGESLVCMNPYVVSEGSLGTIPVTWAAPIGAPAFVIPVDLGSAQPTYSDILAALNIVSGDQLTFLGLSCDDTKEGGVFNGFEYCRVIMEPASGDLTLPFIDSDSINDPNEKNKGEFDFGVSEYDGAFYLTFCPRSQKLSAGLENSMAAAAVILSRNNGSIWQRSKQSLVIRPDRVSVQGHLLYDHGISYLGDAVQSFMTDTSSLLYLNQAGGSGQRGQMIAQARLTGVQLGTSALTRNGELTVRTNDGTLLAVMTGGDSEAVYKLALRAAGSTENFKEATFTSSEASIANIGIVEGTRYSVVLLEDDSVADTFGVILYSTATEAELTAVTVAGTTLPRNGNIEVNALEGNVVATKSQGLPGASYTLGVVVHGQTSPQESEIFANNTSSIDITQLDANVRYDVCLLKGGSIIDNWGSFTLPGGGLDEG